MVLYTVVSDEFIFETSEELSLFDEVQHDGARLLVWRKGKNRGRIERVISTNTAHYLDPHLQPGAPAPRT